MSQDPPSGYNPNPEKSYTDPSSYELPPQSPDSGPSSQHPYQDPPQAYYGEYQQSYYGTQPQGAYGMPGYSPNQDGYGYDPSAPLPLSEAIRQLPNQYVRVLTRPSSFTFATEMGKATWDILWVQLIGYAVIAAALSYLYFSIHDPLTAYNASDSATSLQFASMMQTMTRVISLGIIIIIPASFFMGQGIIYLLAKAFGGNGTFLRQGYTYLLIIAPIGVISSVLNFIPILGSVIPFVLSIYAFVLQIYALMAVHRLSGGKATAVVLIPVGIAIVLGILLGLILVAAVVATMPSS